MCCGMHGLSISPQPHRFLSEKRNCVTYSTVGIGGKRQEETILLEWDGRDNLGVLQKQDKK